MLAADEILVVKDGEVVERGHHKELVKAGGVYTELYTTQFNRADTLEDEENRLKEKVASSGYTEGERAWVDPDDPDDPGRLS